MTMLDHMRRHKAWLKWSLGLVVVAFVLLYVPSFLQQGGPTATDTIATVDGRTVKAGDFRIMYSQQVDAYRQAYGANLNDQLLKQLGIEQRLIQQMIDEEAVLAEATRLGLTVTDAEVQSRILRLPALQENGVFIGYDRYRQMLDMQRPPLTPSAFEEQLRRTLMAEKIQAAVTGWVRVSDADIEKEYKTRNEKVKLELAVFNAQQFRDGIQPTDADLQAQFTAHPDQYQIGERRRVRFLSIDALRCAPRSP
jgi:peptidyl-prolyl cis-trans isomerase D